MTDTPSPLAPQIGFEGFLALDVRVGTIVAVEPFPEARKPAFKLTIDFGPAIGMRRSSAQITELYTAEGLLGMQVAAAVNLGPRRIGPFVSEVLTLGFPDAAGRVVLITPDRPVPNGGRLY
jgi:tRNA-binding protein